MSACILVLVIQHAMCMRHIVCDLRSVRLFHIFPHYLIKAWWKEFIEHKTRKLDVCLSVHRCICVEKKNQLDATEWFIARIKCSTCFRHFYAHHQELETVCVLLPPMVCSAEVRVLRTRQQQMQPITACNYQHTY